MSDPQTSNTEDQLTIADYEESMADHRRLVRELDVLLNGNGAAKQASLCDIVSQCARIQRSLGKPILDAIASLVRQRDTAMEAARLNAEAYAKAERRGSLAANEPHTYNCPVTRVLCKHNCGPGRCQIAQTY